MEIPERIRRPWWKKSTTWILLSIVAAAAYLGPSKLKYLAKQSGLIFDKIRQHIGPETVPDYPDPMHPPASTLAAPQSPVGIHIRQKSRSPATPQRVGLTKTIPSTPIPPGQELRPSLEARKIEDKIPFYETLTGRGLLLFLGIAAFFGLLAYALMGIHKKGYK